MHQREERRHARQHINMEGVMSMKSVVGVEENAGSRMNITPKTHEAPADGAVAPLSLFLEVM